MIEAKLKLLLQMSLILIWGMDISHPWLRERELIITMQAPTSPSFVSHVLRDSSPSRSHSQQNFI